VKNVKGKYGVEFVNTVEFDKYRVETMGSNVVTEIPFYPEDLDTVIFKPDVNTDCQVRSSHHIRIVS
jgi:hypothetical protein